MRLLDAIREALVFPVVNSTANTHGFDVIGRKDDSAQTTVGTTRSLMSYVKGLFSMFSTPSLNSTSNLLISDSIGNKQDTSATSPTTTKSIMAYVKGLFTLFDVSSVDATANTTISNIVGNKQDTQALNISNQSSIVAYLKNIVSKLNTMQEWYGWASTNISRGALTPITIDSGNNAYGDERVIYTGSGITGAYLSVNILKVTDVTTPSVVVFMELYKTEKGSVVSASAFNTGDYIQSNSHGLSNGDKILMSNFSLTPGFGWLENFVYYVTNASPHTFTVSKTLGGSTVTINSDVTLDYQVLTQEIIAEAYIYDYAHASYDQDIKLESHRIPTTSTITVRAKSNGTTNTLSAYLGIIPYAS